MGENLSPSVGLLGIKKINSNKKISLRERRANMGGNLSLSTFSSASGSGVGKKFSFGSFGEVAFKGVQAGEPARNQETLASP